LARGAVAAGFDVTVVTRVQVDGPRIAATGARVAPLAIRRRNANPFGELRTLARLVGLYRSIRPDVVHHVALKPVIYGTIAASLAGVPRIVNAMAGLGFVFTSRRPMARLLRPLVLASFRWLLGRPGGRVVLQNPDDRCELVSAGAVLPDRITLIRGSGVDLAEFPATAEPPGPPVVVLPSRMVRDKGVGEFVEAATELRRAGVDARFVLCGDPDPENPTSVSPAQLEAWKASGVVEWWGYRADMARVFEECHLVCLPSYREGLPKVLLEAAASGRAIVTTDVPGCREVVRHGENGLLVPARSVQPLAQALKELMEDPERRARYGRRGREIVAAEFSIQKVVEAHVALYREQLA
jgi:glycosyltransferase involved in cell wall biosynthesis